MSSSLYKGLVFFKIDRYKILWDLLTVSIDVILYVNV